VYGDGSRLFVDEIVNGVYFLDLDRWYCIYG